MSTDNQDHFHTTTAIDTRLAKLELDSLAQDARIRALEAGTPPPPPPPPPPPIGGVYGPAINCDSKSNLQVGWTNRAKLSHRFRASSSSVPTNLRFAQRGGAYPYSGGTGGAIRATIQGDVAGLPNGQVFGTASYGPKNPSGGVFDVVPVTGGKALTKGQLFHVVYENVDANPTGNWISVNHLFVFGSSLNPRQPKFPDTDMAVLYASPTNWVLHGQFTPVFDLTYADGTHDGQGFVGMISLNSIPVTFASVSGSSKVRERFTPAQDVSISEAWVRVRRTGGNSALNLILDGAGTPIVLGSVAASKVPITSSGNDNGGSVWVQVAWVGAMTLRAGIEYSLRLDCPADTTYTTAPIRAGTDSGFAGSLSFNEGTIEATSNGTSWAAIYPSSPLDMQAYLR